MLRASLFAFGLISAGMVAGPVVAQQALDVPSRPYGVDQNVQYTLGDLQRALSGAGYDPGPMDGVMGPSTRRALAEFQQDMGLRVTGEPSPQVVRILERRGLLTAQAPQQAPQQAPRQWGDRAYDRSGMGQPPGMGQQQRAEPGWQQQQQPPTGQEQGLAEPPPDLVADVQAALRDQGYSVREVTGALDSDTRAAIRTFQRRQGLPATGQPTPELLALIETAGQAPSEMTDAEVIREIQVRLHNRGYNVGPIDGRVDQPTADAIAKYQAERGLRQTGQPSRDLLADLQQADAAPAQAQAPDEPVDIFRQLGERALQELGGGQGQGGGGQAQ